MYVIQIGSVSQVDTCNADVTNDTDDTGWVYVQYTLDRVR